MNFRGFSQVMLVKIVAVFLVAVVIVTAVVVVLDVPNLSTTHLFCYYTSIIIDNYAS